MQLGYKPRFAKKLREGTKYHTIRKFRVRRPFRVGDELQHLTGSRFTKGGRPKVIDDNVCTDVRTIILCPALKIVTIRQPWTGGITIKEDEISVEETPVLADRFAQNDGFENAADFFEYWLNEYPVLRSGLDIEMQLICWKPFYELYPELK